MAAAHYPLKAFCPNSGEKTLKLMDEDVQIALKYRPRHKFYELSGDRKTFDGSCVQEVLLSPKAIFVGLRQFQQGGVCYVGRPSRRWFDSGSQGPPPPGMVYTVFVNPRDMVFDWGWERSDQENPEWPEGYQDRFYGGRLWPPD